MSKTFLGSPCKRHPGNATCERYTVNGTCVTSRTEAHLRLKRENPQKLQAQRELASITRREARKDPLIRGRANLLRRLNAQRPAVRCRNAAEAHTKEDLERGHLTPFPSHEARRLHIDRLAEFYFQYPEPERCRVPCCTTPATEWDEVEYGKGHILGNVSRLCQRHNRLKRDAVASDLENLLHYIREHKFTPRA